MSEMQARAVSVDPRVASVTAVDDPQPVIRGREAIPRPAPASAMGPPASERGEWSAGDAPAGQPPARRLDVMPQRGFGDQPVSDGPRNRGTEKPRNRGTEEPRPRGTISSNPNPHYIVVLRKAGGQTRNLKYSITSRPFVVAMFGVCGVSGALRGAGWISPARHVRAAIHPGRS